MVLYSNDGCLKINQIISLADCCVTRIGSFLLNFQNIIQNDFVSPIYNMIVLFNTLIMVNNFLESLKKWTTILFQYGLVHEHTGIVLKSSAWDLAILQRRSCS